MEVSVDIAGRATDEGSSRGSPCGGIRRRSQSTRGSVAVREEVNVDMVACPFHGVYTATILVEAVTVRGWTADLGAAAVATFAGFPDHRAGGA